MNNLAAEAHTRGASREVTALFARLDAISPFEPLEEAAIILNLACAAKGLPGVYSAKYLLNQAVKAQVHLAVRLPADFIVHRKNDNEPFADTPRRPVFPANSDFLCIERHTAHEIYQVQGGTVELRSAANIKPDGTTDRFVAVQPYAHISLTDLRVGQDEIIRLIRNLPNATSGHASEHAPDSAPPAKLVVNMAEGTTNSTIRHSLKSRWNALDTVIEKAIEQAGNDKTADVLLVLRSMALDEVLPFTGAIDGGTLFYTNEKGELVPLTRDGLDGRLRRRRKALLNVDSRR
jgi:hypothetical protein